MERAMWTAASGMQAQQRQIDTIANNLANVNTNGFKRSRAEFQDLMYQTIIAPGTSSSRTTRFPGGIQVGMGVKPASVKKLFSQGEMKQTDNPFDMVIGGTGFFKVLRPDGTLAYTRDGAFTPDSEGQLVNASGFPLDPPITIPFDAQVVEIGRDGTVEITLPGGETNQLGQVELASFVNPTGLLSLGNNLFERTDASGDPIDGTPGLDGLGELQQGFLEISNVSVVTELVDLIAAQRAYELNSRAIQAADEMMQQVNSILR